jgi:hypothetical protein
MPNKITLSNVINKLPSFVQINPETYKGVRYKAKFLDLDYQEEFEAIVSNVIKYQHGCKKRADERRSTNKGKGIRIPLEDIIKRLPSYLIIHPETYKGIRNKAKFTDIEFKETFEGLVCNVLRQGRGYCPARRKVEAGKAILSVEQVQNKINQIYGENKIKLLPESYVNTNSLASFEVEGQIKRINVSYVLAGKVFCRKLLNRWKAAVNARDNFTCQHCANSAEIHAHHILPWSKSLEHRFNVNNGITLCAGCHDAFHGKHRGEETAETLCAFFSFNLDTIKQKLTKPKKIPPA